MYPGFGGSSTSLDAKLFLWCRSCINVPDMSGHVFVFLCSARYHRFSVPRLVSVALCDLFYRGGVAPSHGSFPFMSSEPAESLRWNRIMDRMCRVLLLHNLAMVPVQYLHRGITGAGSPFEVSGPRNRESFWSERPHD